MEIDLYLTNQDCIKMLVGNKVDKVFLSTLQDFVNYLHFASTTYLYLSLEMAECICLVWQESERAVTKRNA